MSILATLHGSCNPAWFLQSQLAVANQSLSESRGEVDKLLTQLKSQKECEDAAMASAKKKHASEVRAMQQKVSLSYQACIHTKTQYWPRGVKSVALAPIPRYIHMLCAVIRILSMWYMFRWLTLSL